jgi:hypothetical protein
MALDLPTPQDLEERIDGISAPQALQRAGDLLTVATGLTDMPTDPMEVRLVHEAVLEMAWYLQARHEDQEEQFSPFNSERIGSYSYQKAQAAVQAQVETGVPAFDVAVAYFSRVTLVVDTQWVFPQQWGPHAFDLTPPPDTTPMPDPSGV